MDEGGYKVSGYHLIYMGFRYTVCVPSGIGLVIWKKWRTTRQEPVDGRHPEHHQHKSPKFIEL